ncbi:MAG: hypothetical protein QM617_04680 [Comamonas sp.]
MIAGKGLAGTAPEEASFLREKQASGIMDAGCCCIPDDGGTAESQRFGCMARASLEMRKLITNSCLEGWVLP